MSKPEIFLRNDDNPDRKHMRSILRDVVRESRHIEKHTGINYSSWIKAGIWVGIVILLVAIFSGCAAASTVIQEDNIAGYSLNQWCEAIRHAEGVNSKHPYGILAKYKNTTPIQACKNTVKHKYSQWRLNGQEGAFLGYLASKYCPIGSDADNGTCKNWAGNVGYWLMENK